MINLDLFDVILGTAMLNGVASALAIILLAMKAARAKAKPVTIKSPSEQN